MLQKLNIKTHSRVEFHEITDAVREAVRDAKVESGICVVYVPHTTAGVMINEHADPDVVEDIKARLDIIVPQTGNYKHSEGNSAAHIKTVLTGTSTMVIIQHGELALGTWQGIFFAEYDGPRNRDVLVKIVEDKT